MKNIKIFKYKDIILIGNENNGMIIAMKKEFEKSIRKFFSNECYDDNEVKNIEKILKDNNFFDDFSNKSAYLHVTHKCNLNCKGCYSAISNRNKYDDLKLSEYIKIIDNLIKINVKTIIISGGEPLLNKDILEIVKHCKKNKLNVILISNGTLPIRYYIPIMKYVDQISFSIDGWNNKISFLRDKNILNKIKLNIKFLKKYKNKMSLIVILHKKNIKYIKNYINLSNKLKIPISFSLFDSYTKNEFSLDADDFKKLEHLSNMMYYPILDTPIESKNIGCQTSCGAGNNLFSVDAFGNLYPCHLLMHEKYKICKAQDENIMEHIKNGQFYKINVDDFNKCKKCKIKYLCGGGCRKRALNNSLSVLGKDPCCKLFKKTIIKNLEDLINEN